MLHKHFLLASSALTAVAAMLVMGQVARTDPARGSTKSRAFEIRTYTTEPGKLDALHARFRDHTTKLFEKHGMTNIGYWTPGDEPRAKDTLIYIIAHESRAAARKNWEGFVNDPEWIKARDESEVGGKIVSKVESVFVNPTDYSPLQ
ncbi:MAG: NIPSNAP family protein [Pirellulales bacterium]